MDAFIVIRHISVENANAIAGQTWGFPAVSNFLGYTHALQRRLSTMVSPEIAELTFSGCAIICHQFQVHAHQAAPYSEHVFSLTRNPLTKEAKSPSFVEEGRMHMTVSLIIGIEDLPLLTKQEIATLEQQIQRQAESQRLAGGTITSIQTVKVKEIPDGHEEQAQQANFCLRTLLPGFALVSRTDLLAERSALFANSETPELEAWLDASTLHINADNTIERKPYSGWIKPICVGYRAISKPCANAEVDKTRDSTTPVCFVENVYSLAEWISPHRIHSFNDILWEYSHNSEDNTYQCSNNYHLKEQPSL